MKTYPGKLVPEELLREARERAWARLMDAAREQAARTGERAKVVGMLNTPRSARVMKARWTYLVLHPEGWLQ